MNPTKRTCPKCSAEMVVGLIVDLADKAPLGEWAVEPTWIDTAEIKIERTTWPSGYIKNLAGRDRRPVVTYRCGECNLLESYAGPSLG